MTNRAYELAKEEIGVLEQPGRKHNPKIVEYFREVGHSWVTDDETAWCAAFVGAMLSRSGVEHTGKLTARSYESWGEPVALSEMREGDLAVFKRGNSSWQGHVAFVVADEGSTIRVLGGNQSNTVNEANYSKSKLLCIRRHSSWDDREDDLGPVIARHVPMPPKESDKPDPWKDMISWDDYFKQIRT